TLCYERRAFYIVDSVKDAKLDALQATNQPDPAIVADPVARNAALYFPWLQAPDPKQDNTLRDFPPSGSVAGIYARTDANRGVWKAPAGSEAGLIGVSGLTINLTDKENGTLNVKGIDCLRTFPVYGTLVWGDRTLLGNNDRPSD